MYSNWHKVQSQQGYSVCISWRDEVAIHRHRAYLNEAMQWSRRCQPSVVAAVAVCVVSMENQEEDVFLSVFL